MIDIVELHKKSSAEVRASISRLDEAVRQHEDKVDVSLMLEVLDDMTAAKFTIGDLAAIYTYRLGKRRHG